MWSVMLGGSYVEYDDATSRAIEAAHSRGEMTASITVRNQRYTVCFASGTQRLESNPNRKRSVQRQTPVAPAPGPIPQAPVAPAQAPTPHGSVQSAVDAIAGAGSFGLGFICGPTGSGKSHLLDALVQRGVVGGAQGKEQWPKFTPVVSHLSTRRGGVPAAMDRLNTIGLNTVPTWVLPFGALSNGQQERCSLALALDSRCQFDDFGGFVEPHTRRLLAAGMSRIVRKAGLRDVVIASVDAELAAWLQPDWLVTLDTHGAVTLRLNNKQGAGAAGGRPGAADISIAYRSDAFDSGGAALVVDPVLALARRHGATAEASSSLAATDSSPGLKEIASSVTIDADTVEACKVTGLETSHVNQRRSCPARYVVPPQLTDEQQRSSWRVAVVLGASGSGKSLALKAVQGSFRRPRGDVALSGVPGDMSSVERQRSPPDEGPPPPPLSGVAVAWHRTPSPPLHNLVRQPSSVPQHCADEVVVIIGQTYLETARARANGPFEFAQLLVGHSVQMLTKIDVAAEEGFTVDGKEREHPQNGLLLPADVAFLLHDLVHGQLVRKLEDEFAPVRSF